MSNPDYLLAPEAQEYLRLPTLAALYATARRGNIAYSQPSGRKMYFKKSDLDAFLARGRRAANYELADKADAILAARA